MRIVAFDAKEFLRSKCDVEGKKLITFYSPLGIGVEIQDKLRFKEAYLAAIKDLKSDFNMADERKVYDSKTVRDLMPLRKAIPFCDRLIQKVQGEIERIYFSYIILPSKIIPSVEVGGFGGPKYTVSSADFLRNVGPSFSYITAWNYFGLSRSVEEVHIDSFRSKKTTAWTDLLMSCTPKIFAHGDECNPYISLADMIAFMTDKKLYDKKAKLAPENLTDVWASYGFAVETHFLDINVISKYKWINDELIDYTNYIARPILFIYGQDLPKLQERLKETPKYSALVNYACDHEGCIHGLDLQQDFKKVKDGDIIIYVGASAQKTVQSIQDIYNVEVYSLKEFVDRKK